MKQTIRKLTHFLFYFLLFTLPAAHAKDSAIIVFDASGSMWGQIDGKNKITIARDVMGTLVNDWHEDIELGLIAYGHREKGNCADIEVLLPVAKLDDKKILKIINQISPKGKTPISDALTQAAKTLRYTEDPATVILISDGEETCDADPCIISKELEEKGINFTAHVIGFDIKNNKKAQEQLKCIAENTGGQFFEAEDAVSLKEAIVKVKKEVVDPRPTKCKQYAEDAVKQEQMNLEQECSFESKHWTTDYATHFDWCMGEAIGSGLPDEKYRKHASQLKKCEADKKPKKTASKGKGILEFNWAGRDYWQIFQGDKNVGNTNMEEDMYLGKSQQALQAGTYTIKAVPNSLGNTVFSPFEVTIKKGETITLNKGGVLKFNWVDSSGDYWQIFQGDKNVGNSNSEKEMYSGKSHQALQAGTYTIKAVPNSLGNTVFDSFEVTIKKGETVTIDKGGVLEFNWAGDDYWQIFQGHKNVGNTNSEEEMYSGKSHQALQAGAYTIKAVPNSLGNTVFDSFAVTIKKGETITIDKGGILQFNWGGNDYWKIFQDDMNVGNTNKDENMYLGKSQQALQAGTYTIKAVPNSRGNTAFDSFEVTIKAGETLTVDK